MVYDRKHYHFARQSRQDRDWEDRGPPLRPFWHHWSVPLILLMIIIAVGLFYGY